MTQRMLISATRPKEVRGAIIDDNNHLIAYELEVAEAGLKKGNVYLGTVSNVERSLNAAFIDYGAHKQGFLPSGDVCPAAYHSQPKGDGRPKIDEVLRRRRRILVQVVKDEIGNKGAALTTEIALAGRFLVFTPYDSSVGISRKIEAEGERQRLREIVGKLKLPDGYGLIVRTSAEGHSDDDIKGDLDRLVEEWRRIDKRANSRRTKAGTCLYRDNDLTVRMIRDQFSDDCAEVLVDTDEAYEAALAYFKSTMPKLAKVVKRWDKPSRILSHFGVESQIAEIYERRVGLPSGGYLIIEPTEALIVVDVNSGKSTSGASQPETAYSTNLEAADELARQLRLRDLGGLVVVDFIDMAQRRHNRAVEKRLKTALKADRARCYVGQISDNGLLEINRQRIKQALRLQTHERCPNCRGSGLIRGSAFGATSIIRRIEERAAGGRLREVQVDVHPDLAHQLLNHDRAQIFELEQRYAMTVTITARPRLGHGEEQLVWDERPTGEEPQTPAAQAAEAQDEPERDEARGQQRSRSKRSDPNRSQSNRSQSSRSQSNRSQSNRSQKKQSSDDGAKETQSDEQTDRPASDQSNGEGENTGRRRRRRRRRGGRRRGRSKNAANGENAVATESASSEGASSEGASSEGASSEGASPADDSRRKTEPQDAADDSGSDENKPRRSRSRRRRRSKSADGGGGGSDSEPKAEAKPSDESSDSGEGSKRRSRRRRRGGKGNGNGAKTESKDATAA